MNEVLYCKYLLYKSDMEVIWLNHRDSKDDLPIMDPYHRYLCCVLEHPNKIYHWFLDEWELYS